MNLSFFIAKRYLFSKKSHNIINIISAISTFTVAVVTAAMVIVISAFNGLEKSITDIYKSYDPDIVITPAAGKVFTPGKDLQRKLDGTGLIQSYSYTLEENVLLRFGEQQSIAVIKGVTPTYKDVTAIDTMIPAGDYYLGDDTSFYAVMGYGIAYKLNASINGTLSVYAAKRGIKNSINSADDFTPRSITVAGIFSIQAQPEYDDKYVIAPLAFVQDLLGRDSSISAIEIKLKPGTDIDDAKAKFEGIAGTNFTIKNRYQLHEVLFKVINSEKWAIFLILSLIMLIAVFNTMGSLTMLIVEKKTDAETLRAMGLDSTMLRNIFRKEGFLISIIGATAGTVFGLALCYFQLFTDAILMAGEGSLPYPIHIRTFDIAGIFLVVMAVGFVVSWLTARRTIRV